MDGLRRREKSKFVPSGYVVTSTLLTTMIGTRGHRSRSTALLTNEAGESAYECVTEP